MKTNPLVKGVVMENFAGVGTVTDEMVQARAVELALINGRTADQVSETDVEQAKRELTGGSDADPNDENLESISEADYRESVPGSSGHQVPNSIDDDEDGEGRSIGEQLVNEGVNEAEHDQMLQAARDAEKKDPTEKTDR